MIEEPNNLHLMQHLIQEDPRAENSRNRVRMDLEKRLDGNEGFYRHQKYQSVGGNKMTGLMITVWRYLFPLGGTHSLHERGSVPSFRSLFYTSICSVYMYHLPIQILGWIWSLLSM